jgi:hypothetical protein
MTPRERAREATRGAGGPDWGSDDQEKLEAAVEQEIIAAVVEADNACAEIVYQQYLAYQNGKPPASALVEAESQILGRTAATNLQRKTITLSPK